MRRSFIALWLGVSAPLVVASTACSSGAPETTVLTQHAETEGDPAPPAGAPPAGDEANECGSYQRNPACDAEAFVQKAWEMGQQDPWTYGGAKVLAGGGCITGLVAAGVAVVGSDGLVALAAAATWQQVAWALGIVAACRETAIYLGQIGVAQNLSCFAAHDLYDRDVFLCQCGQTCRSGISNSGQFGDYSEPQAFTYGYLDRAGTANCYCTNDAKEVQCQWRCEHGWASEDPNDCTCLP